MNAARPLPRGPRQTSTVCPVCQCVVRRVGAVGRIARHGARRGSPPCPTSGYSVARRAVERALADARDALATSPESSAARRNVTLLDLALARCDELDRPLPAGWALDDSLGSSGGLRYVHESGARVACYLPTPTSSHWHWFAVDSTPGVGCDAPASSMLVAMTTALLAAPKKETKLEKTTQCVYWDELEFRAADRAFDAGEWSAALQDEPENEPCGDCSACLERGSE